MSCVCAVDMRVRVSLSVCCCIRDEEMEEGRGGKAGHRSDWYGSDMWLAVG